MCQALILGCSGEDQQDPRGSQCRGEERNVHVLTVPCAPSVWRLQGSVVCCWRSEKRRGSLRQREQVQKQDEVGCLRKVAWLGWGWKEAEASGR